MTFALSVGSMLALSAISCGSQVTSGATGFGGAIVFHFVYAVVLLFAGDSIEIPFVFLMWLVQIMTVFSNPIMLFVVWRDVNWTVVWLVTIPSVVGTLVGTLLLVDLPVATLRYVLGATVMFAALYRWNAESVGIARAAAARGWCCRGASSLPPAVLLTDIATTPLLLVVGGGGAALAPSAAAVVAHDVGPASASAPVKAVAPAVDALANIPLNSWVFRSGAVAAGAISGLLGGMMGVSGPPLMLFIAFTEMRRALARATQTVCVIVSTPMGLVLLYYLSGPPDDWAHSWPALLGSGVGAALGLVIGMYLYRFLSELSSRLIVLAILSLSASTLLAQGDALRACWILVGLGAGVGVLTAARARRE